MEDVLCDFCGGAWAEQEPFIEGHRGSVICGRCLGAAYAALASSTAIEPGGTACRMCLETRQEPAWRSPRDPAVAICRRCVDQAARAIERDGSFSWHRPTS